jgi:phosphoserine aminotransferase
MSSYNRVYNLSAGPGVLPVEVLEQARDEMLNWQGAGLSVMEMSHRSKPFDKIADELQADARAYLGIPDNYKVLFLQGGASTQFTLLCKNFMPAGGSGDFVVTGEWGKKAVKAAKFEGTANVIWDGKDTNYDRAPDLASLTQTPGASFFHYTLNETIQGVEIFSEPDLGSVPVICDMSSNIGSRRIDMSKYAMVYAGAQKNLGPAGMVMVMVREDFLATANENLPEMFSYKAQAENDSRFNTPPSYTMYITGLVFKHWLKKGGIEFVEKNNRAKAEMLYKGIESAGGFYKAHAVPENRSWMNIPFTLADDALTGQFLKESEAAGFLELKGHRSIGGIRASIYNAFPMDGVEALVGFMKEFAAKNG